MKVLLMVMIMMTTKSYFLLSRLHQKYYPEVFIVFATIYPLLVEISLWSQTKSNSEWSLVSLVILEKQRTLLS